MKGIFIRGLSVARTRNPGSALAQYIDAYIMVQFNALLSNAKGLAQNDNLYGLSWANGSHASSLSLAGNIAALDVLNTASTFVLPNRDNSSTGPTISPTSPRPKGASLNTGAVVGGVVAGVVVVIVSAYLLWRRRRKDFEGNSPSKEYISGSHSDGMRTFGVIEPYIQHPPVGPRSKGQEINASSGDQGRSLT